MRKLNKMGISAIEIILVIVIVGLLSGIGGYVYSNNRASKKTHSQTQQQENSTPANNKKETIKYVNIEEFGVRFKEDSSLGKVDYIIGSTTLDDGTVFETASIASDIVKADTCTGIIGDLAQFSAGEKYGNKKIEDNPSAIKVGNYYYLFREPNALCALTVDSEKTERQLTATLKEAVKTLEAISSN